MFTNNSSNKKYQIKQGSAENFTNTGMFMASRMKHHDAI